MDVIHLDAYIPEPNSGCFLWEGGYGGNGRPMIYTGTVNGVPVTENVAVLVLERKLGRKIKSRYWACHTCDNPACVNEAHLYEGTPSQNAIDYLLRGKRHSKLKLTPEDVTYILNSKLSSGELARRYELHRTTIIKIRSRKLWGHVQWK